MTQRGDRATTADEQAETTLPLTDIELKVLTPLVEGASLADVSKETGYSDFVVVTVLKGIQKKTRSNNLVHSTIELVKTGALKI